MKKHLKKIIIGGSVIFFLILITIISKCSVDGTTYTFLYPKIADASKKNSDGKEKIVSEKRLLPSNPVQGEIRLYVDELLLGPQTNRLLPIFAFDSSVEFCYIEKNVLYVGISESSILDLPNNTDIDSRIELFNKNIRKNFKNIEKIVLFIGGKVVNE